MKKKNNFGNWFRELRAKKGLSQSQVSNALKFSTPQYISSIERGLTVPSFKNYAKMMRVLSKKAYVTDEDFSNGVEVLKDFHVENSWAVFGGGK